MNKEQYQEYLKSDKWKLTKEFRKQIDSYKCTKCGEGENLEVHHKTYIRVGNENIHDLITLCRDCHELVHGQEYFDNYCKVLYKSDEYKKHLKLKRNYDIETKGWSIISEDDCKIIEGA